MNHSQQTQISCPYCGEPTEIHIDTEGDEDDLVEDCTVCCRPIMIHVELDEARNLIVSAGTDYD